MDNLKVDKMWKKIVAVVALLQFVCAQSPKWKYDKPMGTFGASAKLVCTFPGTVTIKDKNNKIMRDNRPKYELTQSQVDTTLKITNLGIDDCGEYHCIAGNKRATLVLGLTVQIEEPKSEYDLANGDKGTVPIVVKGCSLSEIKWEKKDTSGSFKSLIVLDNGVSSGPEHDSGRMSINPANGNLIIKKVQSSDAGSYQLVHSDGSNELTKQTTVNTGDKPILEKKPVASYDATEGEPLTLPCTFKASITSSSWEQTKVDGTKKRITATSGRVKVNGTNLEIGYVQISDKGSYTCSGTNKFGTSTTTTKINPTRKGLKLNGSGYLIYTSSIQANTSSLVVTGTFSIRNKNQQQVIVAVESKDGKLQILLATSSIKKGCLLMVYVTGIKKQDYVFCDGNFSSLNVGVPYNFTTTLSMTMGTNKSGGKEVSHIMKTDISQWSKRSTPPKLSFPTPQWNFENAKIYVGGYTDRHLSHLSGCLSDVVVNGTNIINTYFSQSPSHTNPIVNGGPLLEKAVVCNTTSISIKKPSDATSLLPMQNVVTITLFLITCISFNQ